MSGLYVVYPPPGGGGSGGGPVGSGVAQLIAFSLGTVDGQSATVSGGTITSASLWMQSATSAAPGLVNTGAQTFGGVKTFLSPPQFSSLAPNVPLITGSGGTVVAGSISLTAQVFGVLPAANMSSTNLTQGAMTFGSLSLQQVTSSQFSSNAQIQTNTNGQLVAGSVSLSSQVTGILPQAFVASTNLTQGTNTFGSLSMQQVTSSQFSSNAQIQTNAAGQLVAGSVSLTAQVVGVLPQGNLTVAPTFTQATLGSVTFTSSAGGAAYTVKFPGVQGASGTFIQNDSAGNLSWVAPPAAVTGSVSQTSSAGGAAYTIRWPGAQGTSSFSLAVNDGAGNLSWGLTTGTNVQTFSSGSGVYTPSNGVIAFKATIVGGGGGGGTLAWDGTSGTSSYLITSSGTFVFGNGGGGTSNAAGGLGGIGIGGDINLTGNPGASGMGLSGAAAIAAGNGGGSSILGGGGRGGNTNSGVGGGNGIANSGGGGGGATIGSSSRSGGGGAGTAIKYIKSPLTTYSYYIGAGSVGSSIGGASGGSGFIMIEEFFP